MRVGHSALWHILPIIFPVVFLSVCLSYVICLSFYCIYMNVLVCVCVCIPSKSIWKRNSLVQRFFSVASRVRDLFRLRRLMGSYRDLWQDMGICGQLRGLTENLRGIYCLCTYGRKREKNPTINYEGEGGGSLPFPFYGGGAPLTFVPLWAAQWSGHQVFVHSLCPFGLSSFPPTPFPCPHYICI